MASYFVKLLALTNAVLLALPPNLCIAEVARRLESTQAAQTRAPASKSPTSGCCCCHHEGQATQPIQAGIPQQQTPPREAPNVRCCCRAHDAALTSRSTHLDVDQAIAALAIDVMPTSNGEPTHLPHQATPPSDPPLHILQCVWLC